MTIRVCCLGPANEVVKAVPPLRPRAPRVRGSAGDCCAGLPGARGLDVAVAALGPGRVVRRLTPRRGGHGLSRLSRARCDPEPRAPATRLDGVQAVGAARPLARGCRLILEA